MTIKHFKNDFLKLKHTQVWGICELLCSWLNMLIQQDKCFIPYVLENADTSHSYKTLSLIKHFFEGRPVVEHIPEI